MKDIYLRQMNSSSFAYIVPCLVRSLLCSLINQPILLIDNERYLISRLCSRKSPRWIRQSAMSTYQSALGEDAFQSAVKSLLQRTQQSKQTSSSTPSKKSPKKTRLPDKTSIKLEEPEIIDLTLDEDEDLNQSATKPIKLSEENIKPPVLFTTAMEQLNLSFFIETSDSAELDDLLGCLNVDELKDIMRKSRISIKGVSIRAPISVPS
jgi:hypothetical protein